jgi:heterodisulfide reductase subunit C/nitrate reductase gamma subunit
MFQTQIAYLSLILCLAGILFRVVRWFTVSVGPEASDVGAGTRFAGAVQAVGASLVSPRRLMRLMGVAVLDLLLQRSILRQSRRRWALHLCISYGILMLVVLHVFDDQVTARIFTNYTSTLDPFQLGRHLLGGLVLLALVLALVRRFPRQGPRRPGDRAGAWSLGLLTLIVLSGACLEATQILSPTLFDEMVVDYMGSEDPDEIAPLKAFWAAEFHVGFTPRPATRDPSLLGEGRRLHADFCADCHSPPSSAVLAYPLVLALKPAAGTLDRLRADIWLEQVHFIVSCLVLVLLPWTRLFHLLSTPVNMLVNAGGHAAANRPANRPTRRALGLDACTRCKVCSTHCAVAPIEQVLGNPWILPSEKLTAVAGNAARRLAPAERARLSEGSFICTACGRCTTWCPAGIDLKDLWQASCDDLVRQGYPQLNDWIRHRSAAQWSRTLENRTGPATAKPSLHRPAVRLSDNAETFRACVQCTTCTNVCPVVALSEDPQRDLDLTPQQVMNLMRLRLKTMALGSRMVWDCVSCYKCQEHCPQGVRVADVIYELRNEACRRLENPAAGNASTEPGGQA